MSNRTNYIRNYKITQKEQILETAKHRRDWDRINRRYNEDSYYKAIGAKELRMNLELTKEQRAVYHAQDIIERCEEALIANRFSIEIKMIYYAEHPWLKNQKLVQKLKAKPKDPNKYDFMIVDI